MSEPSYEPESYEPEGYEPEAPGVDSGPPMSREEWEDITSTMAAIKEGLAEGFQDDYEPEFPDEFASDPEFGPGHDEMTADEAAAMLRTEVEQVVHDYAAPLMDHLESVQNQQQVAAASEAASAIVAQHAERLGVEIDSQQAIRDVGAAALHIAESLKGEGLSEAAILAEMESNGTVEALFQWAAEKQVPTRGDERGLVGKYFPSDRAVQTPKAVGASNEHDLVAKYFPR